MRKRIFRRLAVAALAVSTMLLCSAALAERGGSAGGTSWTLNDSGKLTVSGSGEMSTDAAQGWQRYSNEIRSVEIVNGVTSISYRAFSSFENLTEISIPASVASIVTVDDGLFCLDSPELTAISVHPGNPYFTSVDGVLFNKDKSTLIFHPPGITATSYTVPAGVTKIENNAFYESENLQTVVIPNGVTSIGEGAFCRAGLVGAVTIPESVTYLGAAAFESCEALTAVTLPSRLTSIEGWVFAQCFSLSDIRIPSTVTSIGDNAFFWCESLSGITIPSGVTSIGEYAFCGCTGFHSISIPYGVTDIGAAAFCNCDGLADANGFVIIRNVLYDYCGDASAVSVPRNVTRISEYAFGSEWLLGNLTSVTLPVSVETIDTCAFDRCPSLTNVTVYNKKVNFIGNSFTWLPNNITLKGWPGSTAEDYAATRDDVEFLPLPIPEQDFFLPRSLNTISAHAFNGISATAVVIPESVTGIDGNPFANSGVTTIYGFSDSAAEVFADSFGYCFVAVDRDWMSNHGY